ncbi:hypothetical protein JOF42_000404 [Microbacterium phyllosphaerae]|uniref:Uncharacterized protein n=1 Tax=Microbacterium phyllosphaerae TaxID=124798 RepID=A0ABS4WL22_9MICO|nr:hypothetical protein [Microbacterium phyllosphaerae]MBP2376909.1 hypothetical protein [Microbacterium phyllosphaerae]
MHLYEVDAFTERGWWIVDVPDVKARTRASTLSDVDRVGRALLASTMNVDPHSFRLDIRILRATPHGVARTRWRPQPPALGRAGASPRSGVQSHTVTMNQEDTWRL